MTEENMQDQDERFDDGEELEPQDEEQVEEEEQQEDVEAQAPEVKPGDPDGYIKSINKKHRELMDEKRRATALQEELEKLRKAGQQDVRPDVPPPPDPFDADYEEKVKARDDAIMKQASYDARQQAVLQQQQQEQQRAYQEYQERMIKTVTTYDERAKKLGMTPEELQQAGNAVAAVGFRDDLTQYVLEDEHGPLLTRYLAQHPEDINALNAMHPARAGVMLENVIKPKARAISGRTNTPPPPDSLGGGGAPRQQRGPKGATFE